MPRGRQFAPSIESDGIWFPHTYLSTQLNRTEVTSTGQMLTRALEPNSRTFPVPPHFSARGARNYKRSNGFSSHDNRHVFQDCGEYFEGETGYRYLGKRLHPIHERQHRTDKDMLKHFDRAPLDYDYCTTYKRTHEGRAISDGPIHRRFPKQHASESGPAKPAPTISEWFPHTDKPYRIPLQVLATSQEPFPKHNSWKYSNNGLKRIYPSYNINGCLPRPVFNKYGSKFMKVKTVVA